MSYMKCLALFDPIHSHPGITHQMYNYIPYMYTVIPCYIWVVACICKEYHYRKWSKHTCIYIKFDSGKHDVVLLWWYSLKKLYVEQDRPKRFRFCWSKQDESYIISANRNIWLWTPRTLNSYLYSYPFFLGRNRMPSFWNVTIQFSISRNRSWCLM